jgi:hypothetical protein
MIPANSRCRPDGVLERQPEYVSEPILEGAHCSIPQLDVLICVVWFCDFYPWYCLSSVSCWIRFEMASSSSMPLSCFWLRSCWDARSFLIRPLKSFVFLTFQSCLFHTGKSSLTKLLISESCCFEDSPLIPALCFVACDGRWRNRASDLHVEAQDGSTPLMVTAQNGQTDCMRLLMEAGASKDAVDRVRFAMCLTVRECLRLFTMPHVQ